MSTDDKMTADLLEASGYKYNAEARCWSKEPAPTTPFGVGGGLVAIKTLLSRDPCAHANVAIEMIDSMLAERPSPPPECKTDAEKTAFAFGWFKALETARRTTIAPEPFAFTDSYGNLWTKSAAQQLIDKSILLPLYVGKPEQP